jgi:hypothetical protein
LYSDKTKKQYSREAKFVLDRFNRLYSVFEDDITRAIKRRANNSTSLSSEVLDWLKSLNKLKQEKSNAKLVGKYYCRILFLLVLSQGIFRSLSINVIETALDYGIHRVRDLMREFIKNSQINERVVVNKVP